MAMPRRIVSLLSSATEILYALGLGDRVAAVSHECDYPPAVLHKPEVTFSHVQSAAPSGAIDQQVRSLSEAGLPLYQIDVELLAALRPELIVTQAQCDVCSVRYADVLAAVAAQPALRDTTVLALNPQSLSDILADVERVGVAAGCPDRAAEVSEKLSARVARVRDATAGLSESQRPRVACIEWIEPLMLAANWVPEIVELAGGKNLLSQAGRHSTYTAWSDLAELDPQRILVMPCGFDLPRTIAESAALARLPGWKTLSAVRGSRVFAVDGSAYFNRSGPRIVDSLEILAHLVHPQRFGPPQGVDANAAWRQLAIGS
jgi:iron complex transport system substrate-binding protein